MQYEHLKTALYPDTSDVEDFTYARVERLLGFVEGRSASDFAGRQGFEEFSDRVQPHSPGLRARMMWYGGGSLRSAQWAGAHAMNLLSSSVVFAEPDGPTEFAEIQRDQILAFRAAHPDGAAARVSQGLVVIPTDSATPEQRAKYAAYVDARTPRTAAPQGPRGMLFARDLIGSSAQIAEQLWRTPASGRSTRSPSPCRSPSNRPTTCRFSPTSRRSWVRLWAGVARAESRSRGRGRSSFAGAGDAAGGGGQGLQPPGGDGAAAAFADPVAPGVETGQRVVDVADALLRRPVHAVDTKPLA